MWATVLILNYLFSLSVSMSCPLSWSRQRSIFQGLSQVSQKGIFLFLCLLLQEYGVLLSGQWRRWFKLDFKLHMKGDFLDCYVKEIKRKEDVDQQLFIRSTDFIWGMLISISPHQSKLICRLITFISYLILIIIIISLFNPSGRFIYPAGTALLQLHAREWQVIGLNVALFVFHPSVIYPR